MPSLIKDLSRVILCAILCLGACDTVDAASILVNTADDELNSDGDCSLREAIETANTGALVDDCNLGDQGSDTISILVNGTIAMTSALPIVEAVTIQGLSAGSTTLSGSNADRIFDIDVPAANAEVLIRNMTIENGYSAASSGGGGIIVRCVGTLHLKSVEMRDNSAVGDGGINGAGGALLFWPESGCGAGRLEVVDSAFVDNESARSFGGALYVSNTRAPLEAVSIESSLFLTNSSLEGGAISAIDVPVLSIQDSRFEGNQIDTKVTAGNRHGGALYVVQTSGFPSTTLTLIERSSFLFNFSGEGGGAAYFAGDGVASIRNSLAFNNNIVQSSGGRAFDVSDGATLALFFTSIINNGSGLSSDVALRAGPDASIALSHTIVANDWPTDSNCQTWSNGTITSSGFNIDSGSGCSAQSSDLFNTDPRLAELSSFSELDAPFDQAIMVPLDDSPAIDGGVAGDCPGPLDGLTSNDQRKRPRPVTAAVRGTGPICDIGAIEFQSDDARILFRDRFEQP